VWRHEERPLRVSPGEGLLGADVVFPALHGPFGEDGTVQGLLESLAVAYVGSGVAASAVCLNKVLFKQLMRAAGTVPQVAFVGVHEERFRARGEEVLREVARLGTPVFVKPAHLGSSLGIVEVGAAERLPEALEAAFAYDELAIVEAMARGIEVECGVLGRLRAEREAGAASALASVPGEIVLAGGWYDFQAKYEPGGMELRVPARISPAASERVRELAVEAFARAGCEGLARVDFFVDGEEVLVNELNTMPGFTPTSVYAKLMESSGIGYAELVERLCRLGLERHERTRAHRH
jgi:D-alanine-D-alanine ligase